MEIPPENLLFPSERLEISPYLTPPKSGSWMFLPDGNWLHVETGSIWPDDANRVFYDESVDILNAGLVFEDILDAEYVSYE